VISPYKKRSIKPSISIRKERMVLLLSGFDIEYDLTAPPLKFGETRLSWHMDQAYYALTKKLVSRFIEPLSKSSYGIDLPNTPIKKKNLVILFIGNE
jgi:hypothetical protein